MAATRIRFERNATNTPGTTKLRHRFPRPLSAALVLVLLAGAWRIDAAEGDAAIAPEAVLLETPVFGKGGDGGMLVRELARQAVLIAARDEFGLATRDSLLGEIESAGPNSRLERLHVEVDPAPNQILLVKLSRHGANGVVPLKEFKLTIASTAVVENVASQLEAMSRGDFLSVLEQAGCSRKPVRPASKAEVPQKIAEPLRELTCLAQFSALRSLHGELRTSGESPALLAALCHAYANLGTLTECHWSPAHKVFKARALLYAERLLAKYPEAAAHRTRAYVRALVGLHQAALDDLELADKQSDKAARKPDWVDVIDAYCKWDQPRLAKAAGNGPEQKLARYLQVLASEVSPIIDVRLRAAKSLLDDEPSCMRAIESVMVDAPLGIARRLSAAAPQLFATRLYEDALQIAELPQTIRESAGNSPADEADEISYRALLIEALRDAGRADHDHGEPSLQAAAQLVQETSFVHAWRLLSVARYSLGVNADDTLRAWRPLITGHRYAGFIEAHVWDSAAAGQAFERLAVAPDDPYLEATEEPMIRMLANRSQGPRRQEVSLAHNDAVFRDLVDTVNRGLDESAKAGAARRLREICPLSPMAGAAAIAHDWTYAQSHAAEWEQKYAEDAMVLNAFAKQYLALKRPDDAERCLKRSIEAAPDQHAYRELARLYKTKGDDAAWSRTLELSLEIPSYGLEDTHTRVELARHFMKKNDLANARPYADEAAESWAAWALHCAADCHELQHDWDGAETYIRRQAERYDSENAHWYLWCRATGHGDLATARRLALNLVARSETTLHSDLRTAAAVYYYFEQQNEKSLGIFREILKKQSIVGCGLHAAFIADEMGNAELRDTLLLESQKTAAQTDDALLALIRDFRKALAANPIPLDVKLNEWRMHGLPDGQSTNHSYFLGKFLLLRGRTDEALPYLQRAAGTPENHKFTCRMAGHALLRRGISPTGLRVTEFAGETASVFELLAPAYEHLRKREFDLARESVDKTLQQKPDSLDALYVRARIFQEQEQFDKAVTDYTRCQEQLADAPDLFTQRGKCQEELPDFPAAIRDYEKALEIDPGFGPAAYELATLYATCEDPQFRSGPKAIQFATKALEADSFTWANRNALYALALAESGRFKDAEPYAQRAFELARGDAKVVAKERLELYQHEQPYHRAPRRIQPAPQRVLVGCLQPVTSVHFLPGGERVLASCGDYVTRVWNLGSGELELSGGWNGQSSALSPDGKLLAVAAHKRIRLFDTTTYNLVRDFAEVHTSDIATSVFSPLGDLLATSGTEDNLVCIWKFPSGELHSRYENNENPVRGLAVTPDSRQLLTGNIAGAIRKYDLVDKREILELPKKTSSIAWLSLSTDGKLLLEAGQHNQLHVRDVATGNVVHSYPSGVNAAILQCQFSADGRYIAFSATDKTVQICDAGNHQVVLRIIGFPTLPSCLAFASDGRTLAVGCGGELLNGKKIRGNDFGVRIFSVP